MASIPNGKVSVEPGLSSLYLPESCPVHSGDRVGGSCKVTDLEVWPGLHDLISLATWRQLVLGDTVYPVTAWCLGEFV